MQLSPGMQLQQGKYVIKHALGQGGFGITYEAEQVALHRRVAIKEFFMKEYCDRDSTTSHVTLGTSEGSKELVERFRSKFVREAQMIAGFDNPHIIRIHDIFEENGTAYYVMAFLDGGSLADKVKKDGPMLEEQALNYIKQVGDALDYIHKQNVLHLDVKPSNILINAAGEAVLIDFGISKHYDAEGGQTSTTPAGISKGYAPVEQYQQGNLTRFTPATDIYSLGATLYFLLTGEVPPEAAEVYEDGLPEIKADVSVTIKGAIEKAMAPKRKDRPQSIGAFISLLSNSVSSGAVDQIEKPKKSHPEDESTKLNKPQPSGNPQHGEETEYVKPLPQTPVAPLVDSATAQSNSKSKKLAVIAFLVLAGLLGLLALFSHIWNNDGARSTDAIYIDGAINRSVSFDASGGNQSFSIEKTFNSDWVYNNLPEWLSVNSGSSAFTIMCDPNYSPQSRSAALMLYKTGSSQKLAAIYITQSGKEEPEKQEIKASSITMQKTGLIEGAIGEQFSIDYTVQPKEAQKHKITWTSSNPSIASISSNGTITAKANGKITITAKVDGVSASCLVEVRIKTNTQNSTLSTKQSQTTNNTSNTTSSSSSTSARSLNHSYEAIYTGRTVQLSVNGYRGSVTWKSDAPSIASVSSNGLVTGQKVGQTIIWAHFGEGEPLKCYISVVENSTSSTKQSQTTNNTSNTTSSSSSTSARSLNHSYEAIYTGRTVQLSVNGYRGSVTWKSDAPSIASVSSNGLVTGRKAGKTIIWAHFGEGEPLKCYISVVENSIY